MNISRKQFFVLSCFLVFVLLILFAFFHPVKKYLKVAFLDIGQGDAIFIEAPNGIQIMVDGGGDSRVIPKLSRVMPFGDRSLDMIVITNPDKDHIGGFNDILRRYSVRAVLEPGTHSSTSTYSSLISYVSEKNIPVVLAQKGMTVMLDAKHNIYYEILFPDRDVSNWDRNNGSLVGRLVYGESSFLLMGDSTIRTEDIVSQNEGKRIQSDVLKLGHHGSRTSSGESFLKIVKPQYAIISAGKDNSYGHPHPEIISRLQMLHIPYFLTFEKGTVLFKTDGIDLSYRFVR